MAGIRAETGKGRVLIVGAHPDDETLGCGGTIAKMVAEGREVFITVLTRGENLFAVLLKIFENPSREEVAAIRREETRQAARILGVRDENVTFMGYEDGNLQAQKDAAIEEVVGLLRKIEPAEVYCLNAYEVHVDHRATYEIVRAACARVGRAVVIRPYFVILKSGVTPTDLPVTVDRVDIAAQVAVKRKALAVFRSHLGMLSPRQERPISANFDEFLGDVEYFIREA